MENKVPRISHFTANQSKPLANLQLHLATGTVQQYGVATASILMSFILGRILNELVIHLNS